MAHESIDTITQAIINDPQNELFTKRGWPPVFTAHPSSRIMIVGQAPGRKAQESQKPWNDQSGINLRKWMGIDDETFYDPTKIALVPMDFYYPGKGLHGDLPPRKGFAAEWHPRLLAAMPNVQLILLVGAYSQRYYLGSASPKNLTETVRQYDRYLPRFLPLVHPSPLNFRWQRNNPWFQQEVVPVLQQQVAVVLAA